MLSLIRTGKKRIKVEHGPAYTLLPKRRITGGSQHLKNAVVIDKMILEGDPIQVMNLDTGIIFHTSAVYMMYRSPEDEYDEYEEI